MSQKPSSQHSRASHQIDKPVAPHVDVNELKTRLAAITTKRLEDSGYRAIFTGRLEKSAGKRDIGRLFGDFYTKAGLDVGKLTKLVEQDQIERRRLFQERKTDIAKHVASAAGGIRESLQARGNILNSLPNPLLSYLKVLDKAVLIMQQPPDLNLFIDSNIESSNNWAKILVDTNTDAGRQNGYTFYFMWTNDDLPASVSASTSLILNGACDVSAAPGVFSGHKNSLLIYADFFALRWNGWGTDPNTGQNLDGTPVPGFQQSSSQIILDWTIEGGREIIFGGADEKSKFFTSAPFDFSFNWIPVPARATTLFAITLYIAYGMSDPEANISDLVFADFANNGFSVLCPDVVLEISPIRPLPAVTS